MAPLRKCNEAKLPFCRKLSKSHLFAPKWGNFRRAQVSRERSALRWCLMIMVVVIALAVSTKIFLPFWPISSAASSSRFDWLHLCICCHTPFLERKPANVFTALHLHSIRIRFDFAIAIAFESNCTFYVKPWVRHMNSKLLFKLWSTNFKGLFKGCTNDVSVLKECVLSSITILVNITVYILSLEHINWIKQLNKSG